MNLLYRSWVHWEMFKESQGIQIVTMKDYLNGKLYNLPSFRLESESGAFVWVERQQQKS